MSACSICGRTILAGERVHDYADGSEERSVCELCVARADRLGWRAAAELALAATRPDPAAPPPRLRPTPALDADAPTPFERAVARFNSSEAGRTVAGLTRTLGTPWVSVGAAAGRSDEVRITVAWELSWYQWGVDIGDELRPVFELDKGREIDQLDAPAKQWNAAIGEDGKLGFSGDGTARR
ncbi:MAG TPA: hypothetical protein VFX44_01185 [Solirubrobacterales bacterium]|nr:hypothetical protein [Solirubrobacterales bacterium]